MKFIPFGWHNAGSAGRERYMDLGLEGAAVCVQGGTKGMGRAAAHCFAAEGARVVVLGREQEAIDRVVGELAEQGSPDAFGISVDLSDDPAIRAAFAEIGQRFGELNTLVNAAGPRSTRQLFDAIADEEWLSSFEIGALSAVRCVRAALPWLRKAEWARIVNISAHSTKRQTAVLAPYSAAKSAMTSISKNMSLALGPEEILVNTISPGSFASESLKKLVAAQPPERGFDSENLYDIMRWITEDFGHPAHLPRAGDPSEMGAVIAFVGSKRNSYMTGANINVDGGSDFT
jgi:NAD(P)-dependent dehydrogenase (short-subunit alcohol dehydrogenase family)